MVERNGRTYLRCRFGLHPIVAIFFGVWFAIVGLFVSAAVLTFIVEVGVRHTLTPAQAGPGLIFILGMLVFGIALLAAGKHLARDERGYLIDFLRQTLAAKPAGASADPQGR